MRIGCGSLSIATLVSLLANEIDVQSVLHGQVSLAAVNQICVMHDAVKGCKKSTNSRKCKNAGQAMAVLIVSMVNARTPPSWSSRVDHRDYGCSSDCQRSSPVKQSTNHSLRYKTYRFLAIPSLHWRTGTNQLWSDHRFGLVPLVKPDMRSA